MTKDRPGIAMVLGDQSPPRGDLQKTKGRYSIAAHPLLFAAYPPLALYAQNVALLPPSEVLKAVALCSGAAVLLWGLLTAASRCVVRAASCASLLILGSFLYRAGFEFWRAQIAFGSWQNDVGAFACFYVPIVLGLASLALMGRRGERSAMAFLNVAGIVLVLGPVWTIVGSLRSPGPANAGTSSVQSQGAVPTDRPDIFYIVLDGYGRSDTLQKYLGYSNAPFIEALKDRGFYVADRARSNYSQTDLSMCSSLNMVYLQDLLEPAPNASAARLKADQRIDDSEVSRILKGFGYQFVAITSGAPSIRFVSAHQALESTSGVDLFWQGLRSWTPLPTGRQVVLHGVEKRAHDLRAALSVLRESGAKTASPRFVVAHILAPHPSFVLDEQGRTVLTGPPGLVDSNDFLDSGGSPEDYRKGYAAQAAYVNRRILEAVDAILEGTKTPPVILIQGDHGSRLNFHHTDVRQVEADEAFGILSAYRVPEEVKRLLYPEITPVNSFRLVLSGLFGLALERLPDRSLYSSFEAPQAFVDVGARLAVQPVPGGPYESGFLPESDR